jgi:hypothetical protein
VCLCVCVCESAGGRGGTAAAATCCGHLHRKAGGGECLSVSNRRRGDAWPWLDYRMNCLDGEEASQACLDFSKFSRKILGNEDV